MHHEEHSTESRCPVGGISGVNEITDESPKKRNWNNILLFIVLAMGLLLPSCAPVAPPITPQTAATSSSQAQKVPAAQQREVVVSFSGETRGLDPHLVGDSATVNAAEQIFDTLVKRARDKSLAPSLAESWDMPDSMTYIFHLRKGVKWHDGVEFTADDVKFTFDRLLDPALSAKLANSRYVIGIVASTEVVDKYTVRMKLTAPYAPWIARLKTLYVVPKHYITAVGNDEFARRPIGTGPYKFVEWVPDDHLRFIANEDYWAGAPEVKRAVFKPIPEMSTRQAALLTGAADIVDKLELDNLAALQLEKNISLKLADGSSMYFYIMNCSQAPFNDVRVRQAVAYAIDWDTVLKLFGGYATKVPYPAMPNDFGYAEITKDQQVYNYDPTKARKLLADAGFANGLETTIEVPTTQYPKGVEVTQAVSEQLAKSGIKAKIVTSDWTTYYTKESATKLTSIGMFSISNPIFDPDHYMLIHFDSARMRTQYCKSPKVADLALRGMTTIDSKERINIYREALKTLLEESPYSWGYLTKVVYATRADIDWTPSIEGEIHLDEVSFVKK